MIRSMTAFAHRRSQIGSLGFEWEARSVNGRGLDLRLRLPDGLEGLEPAVRSAVTARLTRGHVAVTLRLSRPLREGIFAIDSEQLDRVLDGIRMVQARAHEKGLTLAPASVSDVLAQRGVVVMGAATEEEGLHGALLQGLDAVLDDLLAMREAEGRALARVIAEQVDGIARLVEEAAELARARLEETRQKLPEALRRMTAELAHADEDRLTQELALIALRNDVTEEIDRLRVHVETARALVTDPKPAGRRLDFLAQEFNREANTLCSKASHAALTRIGLDLKAAIDQMREQVQNVE
ncbi:hypothetical protein ruthe_00959 [Rubellimicrobium thermophilum DSM 16684]|uniref:TIGR00255 family protein n=1 Tax=Rubellimicrobium thermophilum DSM 16684 TaxID=1123069 RepID=S9S7J9_9RHOB|nr:hypothetical protein ruthe_00959 [Rubellimicrobium thermophilum DSM 16684]